MAVDAHIHIGGSRISATDFTESELIGEMDRGGIDAAIVQPFPYPNPEAQRLHDIIAELAVSSRARPGFF